MKRSIFVMDYGTGGCGACGAELGMCFTPVADMQKYGFFRASSPKIADILILWGCMNRRSENVVKALRAEMPPDSIVVSIGDCAGDTVKALGIRQITKSCPCEPQEIINSLLTLIGGDKEGGADENI